ncbi:hypothetical protein A33M_3977 [Rhodovulum sp. PH10]|nr:hypothetical protein A33M_3977 [Rhodovulum sp. PH10]
MSARCFRRLAANCRRRRRGCLCSRSLCRAFLRRRRFVTSFACHCSRVLSRGKARLRLTVPQGRSEK